MFKSMAVTVGGALLIAASVASAAPTAAQAAVPEPARAMVQTPRRAVATEAARLLAVARAHPFEGSFSRYRDEVLSTMEKLVRSAQALEKATPAASPAAYALVLADYQAAKRVFAFMRPTPTQLLEMILLGRTLTTLDPARPNGAGADARTDRSVATYFEWQPGDDNAPGEDA